MYDHDFQTDIDIDDGTGCITRPAIFSTWVSHDGDLPSLTLETVSLGKHKLNREAMCDWLGAAEVARIEAASVPERWAPERRMETAEGGEVMETKWTPGPWSLKIRSGTGESTANEVIAEIEQAGPEGGYRGDIARLQSAKHIGGIADEELVANAHLLFAAPDLYAALKMAQLWLDVDGRFDMQGINAALAKARGEA